MKNWGWVGFFSVIVALTVGFFLGWDADHTLNPRIIVYYDPLWPGTKLPKDTIYRSIDPPLDGYSQNPWMLFNYELSNNLTAAQSHIAELESRPIPTVTITVTPPPVTVEVPTIPPDVTVIWQADSSSDNLTYSEFYTLQQVEEYIVSCNLTVSGNCYEWMMGLAEQARKDGKPIGLALMERERADGTIKEAHFTNFVIIGKKVLRIEPQTGQISNWDGWRLAIP